MRTVVCVGGGRFGAQAAHEASESGARVLVVDRDEQCPARQLSAMMVEDTASILGASGGEILFLKGEGVGALLDILDRWEPDSVIPSASGHLAALLAVGHCRRRGASLAPAPDRMSRLASTLPSESILSSDAENGVVVTSYMREGGLCLEDCDQPATCPVTGETNPVPMHERIRDSLAITVDRHVVLVTSSVGGIGGIPGSELRSLLRELDGTGRGTTWGIATSCRCHGIVSLLRTG